MFIVNLYLHFCIVVYQEYVVGKELKFLAHDPIKKISFK